MNNAWDFSKIRTIYIVCPAYLKTGGTELLHQLSYEIAKYRDCLMFYTHYYGGDPTHTEFKKYRAQYVTHISACNITNENMLIIPETQTDLIYAYSRMHILLWWLSVDNFKNDEIDKRDSLFRELGSTKFSFLKYRNKYLHMAQSQYAIAFLRKHFVGKKNIRYLSDYINPDYYNLNNNTNRKNIVIYNPQKGIEFTRKIMGNAPDITFVPLVNMTNSQVLEKMQEAKVYIDFGNHPGKDRIPREAALQGLCIITGKRGSAKNDKDVPIPSKYKVDERDHNIEMIVSLIRNCFEKYEDVLDDFKSYVNIIRSEKKMFEDGVKLLFGEDR